MGKKDRYTYYVYDDNNNLIFKGLSKEVAKKFDTSTTYVMVCWKNHGRFRNKYRLDRVETSPYIPPVTENTTIQFSNSQEDKALDRLGELYYITTNECPLDNYDFNCPISDCKLECQAPKCWKLWALQNK